MEKIVLTLTQGNAPHHQAFLRCDDQCLESCLGLSVASPLLVGVPASLSVQLDDNGFSIEGRVIASVASAADKGRFDITFQVSEEHFMQARMLLQLFNIIQHKAQLQQTGQTASCDAVAHDWVAKNAAGFTCSFDRS